MSLAKKCDRCGCYYNEQETKHGNGVAFVHLSHNNEITQTWGVKDLCSKCMNEFRTWLYRKESYIQLSENDAERLLNGEVGYATINDKLTISMSKFDPSKGKNKNDC